MAKCLPQKTCRRAACEQCQLLHHSAICPTVAWVPLTCQAVLVQHSVPALWALNEAISGGTFLSRHMPCRGLESSEREEVYDMVREYDYRIMPHQEHEQSYWFAFSEHAVTYGKMQNRIQAQRNSKVKGMPGYQRPSEVRVVPVHHFILAHGLGCPYCAVAKTASPIACR